MNKVILPARAMIFFCFPKVWYLIICSNHFVFINRLQFTDIDYSITNMCDVKLILIYTC